LRHFPHIAQALLAALVFAASSAPRAEEARIVSLVPSFTETLFALGAGADVVGVSAYCAYPPEAAALPRAGGLFDPTIEAIIALKPTLVIVSAYAAGTPERLESLGIKALSLRHDTLEEILASFRALGEAVGRTEAGNKLADAVAAEVAKAREATSAFDKKRTLLVVGRDVAEPTLREIYAAGPSGYLNELLEAAGGENVLTAGAASYPILTAESLIALNPDLILEIADEAHDARIQSGEAYAPWKSVPGMQLVESGRIKILAGDYLNIPGPRIGLTLRDFLRALHPEAARALE